MCSVPSPAFPDMPYAALLSASLSDTAISVALAAGCIFSYSFFVFESEPYPYQNVSPSR